jgi:hypothetical protein
MGSGASGGSSGASGTGGSAGTGGSDGGVVSTQPFDCGSRDVTNATSVSGAVVASRSFSGVVHVTGTLEIRAEPTITIAPGTKFIVAPGASIDVGTQGTAPTIIAEGTPEAPILFCGQAAGSGYWKQLFIRQTVKSSSVLRNVLIADAGGTGAKGALEIDAPISLQGVQVRGSGTNGVRASAFGSNSHALIVKGAKGSPVAFESTASVHDFPPQSDIAGNDLAYVTVRYPTMASGARFRSLGLPYRQIGSAQAGGLAESETFIFDAGVIYELAYSELVDFGRAKVQANGTSSAPVVFRTDCSQLGCTYGGGRVLVGSAAAGTALVNVKLENLGYTEQVAVANWDDFGALDISATVPVTLDGVTISGAWNWGIAFKSQAGLTAQSRAIAIDDVRRGHGYDAFRAAITSVYPGAVFTLPADTRFPSVGQGDVVRTCDGVDRSGTLRALGTARYEIPCGLSVPSGVTLNVEAGVHFEVAPGRIVSFEAGSTANFNGTAERPITFNVSSSLYPPLWDGVAVRSPNVRFNYVHVSNGGNVMGGNGANIIAYEAFTLTNSTISNSGAWGLLKRASDPTDYLLSNVYIDNVAGTVGTLP